MSDEDCALQGIDVIKPDMFYFPVHRMIHEAIVKVYEDRSQIPDMVTVTNQLRAGGNLEKVGGPAYLAELTDSVVSLAHFEHYTDIVKDHYHRRTLIRVAGHIHSEGYNLERPTAELADEAGEMIFDAAHGSERVTIDDSKTILKDTLENIEMLVKNQGGLSGLDTGFRYLNSMTAGLHGGELLIIAARPGMGKTAFALNLAENVLKIPRDGVLIFSLEMRKNQLMQRMLSSYCRVDSMRIRDGKLRNQDYIALLQGAGFFKEARMWIDAPPSLSPTELRARCRRMKTKHPEIKLVIVDYIQLMHSPGNAGQREREVATITRGLKSLANELNLPIIALSQINRESEKGGAGATRPQLSQLRESGAIEQDADSVFFLYRPDYYDKSSSDNKTKGKTELIIAKQRNGAQGTVLLRWTGQFTRFDDPDNDDLAAWDPDRYGHNNDE